MQNSKPQVGFRVWMGALGAVLMLLPGLWMQDGFWVADNENKLLLLQSIHDDPSPPLRLAPMEAGRVNGVDLFPLPEPFAVRTSDGLFSQYSPLFSWLSLPGWTLFGFRGLALLPLAGTLLWLVSVFGLAPRENRGSAVWIPLALCALPMWFYSWTFWEHMPALGLLFGGLALLQPWQGSRTESFRLSGHALLLTAIWFREEYALIWLFAAWADDRREIRSIPRRVAPLLLAAAAGSLHVLFLKTTTGAWLGHHASANAAGFQEWLGSRGEALSHLWLETPLPEPLGWVAGGCLLIVLCLPVAWLQAYRRAVSTLVFILAGLLGAAFAVGWMAAEDRILFLLLNNSFFAAAPVVAAGLIPPEVKAPEDRLRRWRFWRNLAVVFGLGYTFLAPAISAQGMHWAARFLLPVYGFLLLAAAESFPRPAKHAGLIGLALLSLLLQLGSLTLLIQRKAWSAELQTALATREESVWITDTWWVGHAVWMHFSDHRIYYTDSPAKTDILVEQLRREGIDSVLLIRHNTPVPDASSTSLSMDRAPYYTLSWQTIPL